MNFMNAQLIGSNRKIGENSHISFRANFFFHSLTFNR